MALLIVAFAFIFGVGFVLLFATLAGRVPGIMMRRKLDSRLQEIALGDQAPEETLAELVKGGNTGPLPQLDRMIGGTARGSALAAWIEQSGTKASVSFMLMMSFASGMAVGVSGSIFTRTGYAVPIGFAIGAALPFLVQHQTDATPPCLRGELP